MKHGTMHRKMGKGKHGSVTGTMPGGSEAVDLHAGKPVRGVEGIPIVDRGTSGRMEMPKRRGRK